MARSNRRVLKPAAALEPGDRVAAPGGVARHRRQSEILVLGVELNEREEPGDRVHDRLARHRRHCRRKITRPRWPCEPPGRFRLRAAEPLAHLQVCRDERLADLLGKALGAGGP